MLCNMELTEKSEQFARWLAHKIRQTRRMRDLSQERMADLAEMSRMQLHNIERGKSVPTVPTLYRIAAAFDIPLSELIRSAEKDMG